MLFMLSLRFVNTKTDAVYLQAFCAFSADNFYQAKYKIQKSLLDKDKNPLDLIEHIGELMFSYPEHTRFACLQLQQQNEVSDLWLVNSRGIQIDFPAYNEYLTVLGKRHFIYSSFEQKLNEHKDKNNES